MVIKNVYFLDCIGTQCHAVTLSVLVTKGHRFSLYIIYYSVIKNKSYTQKDYVYFEDPSYM